MIEKELYYNRRILVPKTELTNPSCTENKENYQLYFSSFSPPKFLNCKKKYIHATCWRAIKIIV